MTIHYKLDVCPYCKSGLVEGCASMVCPKCHKIFKINGDEVNEDGSNFFIKPSEVNWDYFNQYKNLNK